MGRGEALPLAKLSHCTGCKPVHRGVARFIRAQLAVGNIAEIHPATESENQRRCKPLMFRWRIDTRPEHGNG